MVSTVQGPRLPRVRCRTAFEAESGKLRRGVALAERLERKAQRAVSRGDSSRADVIFARLERLDAALAPVRQRVGELLRGGA